MDFMMGNEFKLFNGLQPPPSFTNLYLYLQYHKIGYLLCYSDYQVYGADYLILYLCEYAFQANTMNSKGSKI